MINFDFIIHRQKISEFPMKSVFMFELKEEWKFASNWVKMKVFGYGV